MTLHFNLSIILDFLNSNSGAFTVIFTAIVALTTIVYSILTTLLVLETKKVREAQTNPKISITLRRRRFEIILLVRNVGFGPAYEINFEKNPDTDYDFPLADFNSIRSGFKSLAPNQEFGFILDNIDTLNKRRVSLEIKITYLNNLNQKYEEEYKIDFSELTNLNQLLEEPLFIIAENLDDIKKIVEDFAYSK